MIQITDSAREKILDILIGERSPNVFLRVFVQGGGCAGFTQGFSLDYDLADDDFSFPIDDRYKLVVDSMSMQYLEGSTVDYQDELMSSGFVINNPKSTGKCGCGSSFSI